LKQTIHETGWPAPAIEDRLPSAKRMREVADCGFGMAGARSRALVKFRFRG
jgi:hypothetical protein